MKKLVLFDLFGLESREEAAAVSHLLRTRLRWHDWEILLCREPFFRQQGGQRVVPVDLEAALGEVEDELGTLGEAWWGAVGLNTFPTALLVRSDDPPDFIVQVGEEIATRTDKLPLVFAVRWQGQEVLLCEAGLLPLKWRCREGDRVLLVCDVWPGAGVNAPSGTPLLRRGDALSVVERSVQGVGADRDCFLTVAAPPALGGPASFLLPWHLVCLPEQYSDDEVVGASTVLAHFRLPCWYHVCEESPVAPIV